MIDTNVLIKQIPLRDLFPLPADVEFTDRYTVHTLQDVIREIKDESARLYIQHLPYEVEIHDSVDQKHFDFVKSFAKETGDFKSLSTVDIKVMALGL